MGDNMESWNIEELAERIQTLRRIAEEIREKGKMLGLKPGKMKKQWGA